jgi:hypothetical protein
MLAEVRAAPRALLLCCIAALTTACGEPAPEPTTQPATELATVDEQVARSPSADGLEIRRSDEGRISIRATDRFGRPLAITYESVDYLESALPTLERSLSGPQIDALRRTVQEERR